MKLGNSFKIFASLAVLSGATAKLRHAQRKEQETPAGPISCDFAQMDTTPPIASCVPGVNAAGNEPAANNQDGFFTVSGLDDVATITQVELIDMGSLHSYGFFDIGTAIKYVQAPGAPPKLKEFKGEVDWKITGNGDLQVKVTDCAGNVGEALCLVPPPPARRL